MIKMTEFKDKIAKLLKIQQSGPAAKYKYIVECVFADPSIPSSGMYMQMGVFKDQKEADEYALKLSREVDIVDFVTFRSRPMRPFRPFFDESSTLLVTGDDLKDEIIIRGYRSYQEKLARDEAMKIALTKQFEAEAKEGSPENITQLVYRCMCNYEKIQNMESKSMLYHEQVKTLERVLSSHPGVDWKTYVRSLGDMIPSEKMVLWFDNTFKEK